MDSHYRSMLKAMSWRAGGTLVTIIICWVISGEMGLAAKVGMADTFIKIFAFYGHERLWDKVGFGKIKKPDYEI